MALQNDTLNTTVPVSVPEPEPQPEPQHEPQAVDTPVDEAPSVDTPLQTANTDSTQTTTGTEPTYNTADSLTTAVADTATVATFTLSPAPTPPWFDGMQPIPRTGFAAQHQTISAIIVFLILALCLTFRHIQRLGHSLRKQLIGPRKDTSHTNHTLPEKRTLLLLLAVAAIFIALNTNAAIATLHPFTTQLNITTLLRTIAVIATYIILQYIAYNTIAYTFTDNENRHSWLSTFTASNAFLGLSLTVPGLVIIFYPDFTPFAVIFAAALYICARIAFISKGFTIFYTNYGSLVYFILYLCSAEIVPLVFVYYLSLYSCVS